MNDVALPPRVSAVLFDMDDTLVDSERAWFAAVDLLWRESGGDPTGKGMLGGTLADLVERYLEDFPGTDQEWVERRLGELLDAHLDAGVDPMPGAPELVRRLSAGFPITVASNSPSHIVEAVVRSLGWEGYFRAWLGTEDVALPKPAPDLYLAAARSCGVDISRCVIFEDSPTGASAGMAAGAFVVTVGSAAVDRGHLNVDSLLDPRIVNWHPQPWEDNHA